MLERREAVLMMGMVFPTDTIIALRLHTISGSAGFWLGGQCPLAACREENFENLTTKWCILKYI